MYYDDKQVKWTFNLFYLAVWCKTCHLHLWH